MNSVPKNFFLYFYCRKLIDAEDLELRPLVGQLDEIHSNTPRVRVELKLGVLKEIF